jgi:rare lipoprotein A
VRVDTIVTEWRIGGRFAGCARIVALGIACAALAGCAASRHSQYSPKVIPDGQPIPKGGGTYKVGRSYQLNGKTYHPSENPRYRSEGIASWYGPDFHGRLTANGEIYDMRSISAAHPTMPLPSYARVTNLDNGRSIIVRVNDRGPYAHNRVIDVSIGAAKALRFYKRGTAHVRVEYVGRAPMEGSSDRVLMATLRQGKPAPAPSDVRVAALTPLSPLVGPWRGVTPQREDEQEQSERLPENAPLPPERPHRVHTVTVASRTASARADAHEPGHVPWGAGTPEPYRVPAQPSAAAFAPMSNETGLGLMSGRGLY